jgi:hypothetical protein
MVGLLTILKILAGYRSRPRLAIAYFRYTVTIHEAIPVVAGTINLLFNKSKEYFHHGW